MAWFESGGGIKEVTLTFPIALGTLLNSDAFWEFNVSDISTIVKSFRFDYTSGTTLNAVTLSYNGGQSATFNSGDTIDLAQYTNPMTIRVWKNAGSTTWNQLNGTVTVSLLFS